MQGKVVAMGTITCQPEEVNTLKALAKEHVHLSNAEPGCIHFAIDQSLVDPCCFHVSEEFVDRDAFSAHTMRTRASIWWAKSQHFPRNIIVTDRPSQEDLVDWTPPIAPPSDLVLEGRLVRLERLNAQKHAKDLFGANSATANWDYLPYGPFETLVEYERWIEAECTNSDPHFFAITRKDSGATVGVASYLRIAPNAGSIEVGHINFSPSLQRHPGATEAMFLMMRWAFENGYRRYEWKCNAANAASRRAAERLGLSFEGVFRQMMTVKGQNRDTAWFAAIDKEWPALSNAFETWLAEANFDVTGHQLRSLWDLTAPFRVADDPARIS